jgi:hypothetical protein
MAMKPVEFTGKVWRVVGGKSGRLYYATVSLRIKSDIFSVISAVTANIAGGGDEEIVFPSWIEAAIRGVALIRTRLEKTDGIEILAIGGSTVDTTEDQVECAAAIATSVVLGAEPPEITFENGKAVMNFKD